MGKEYFVFFGGFAKFCTSIIIAWIVTTLFCAITNRSLGAHKWFANSMVRMFNRLASSSPPKLLESQVSMEQLDNYSEDFRSENSYGKHAFKLYDIIPFVQQAVDNLVEDEITKRFASEQLEVWNLLTRNSPHIRLTSIKSRCAWIIGFFIRYFLLLPCRIFYLICTMQFIAATLFYQTVVLRLISSGVDLERRRRQLSDFTYPTLFRLVARAVSLVVDCSGHSHMEQAKCLVANHTTPLDVVILSTNGVYSLIGQRQGGLFGIMQQCLSAMASSDTHVWFDRQNPAERHHVLDAMRQMVHRNDSRPILIFPEGTCINNTSLMLFRRGAFELDVPIQPVVIKYDPQLGDAFWNSQRFSFGRYVLMLLTSWAVKADVHYLPVMSRLSGESTEDFASRVKKAIAIKGGFINLPWDGNLKRTKPNAKYKEEKQLEFCQTLEVHRSEAIK